MLSVASKVFMNNGLNKFLFEKRKFARFLFFLLADTVLIILSVILAFIVRFEGAIPLQYLLNVQGIVALTLIITLPVFYFFKLYFFTWRYVSAEELVSLTKAVFLSFLILTAAFFVLKNEPVFSGFPRSTLFITYFFIFVLCGGLRFSKRIYFQLFANRPKEDKERTLIVGAGDAGEQILRSILILSSAPYLPIGFIDNDLSKQGDLIHGLKVLGKIEDIADIVKTHNVESLIIAIPSADSQVVRQAVEKGREAGLKKIKTVPGIEEIINGKVSIGQLRQVGMEDLLGRQTLSLEKKSIEHFLQNKKILITGAAGSIGSELCRQIAKFNPAYLILLDQDESSTFNLFQELEEKFPKLKKKTIIADITDKEKIERVFDNLKPNIVFHAAAYKHVPLMEEHYDAAIKNNIFGTKIVAQASIKNKTDKFIFISTDKAVNPSSVMGATKRVGEMVCQALNQKGITKFVSVRFGNVLDSRGSVIPIFRERIKRRLAIQVTHPEMKRFFMVTSEACLLVLQASQMGQGSEVFVLDMGGPIKIMDLAKEMIRLSGLEPDKDIPIVYSAPRPGEKLFEEILTAEEGTLATKHEKIFTAKLSQVNIEKIELFLKKLEKAVLEEKRQEIMNIFKEIIPTYKPIKYN